MTLSAGSFCRHSIFYPYHHFNRSLSFAFLRSQFHSKCRHHSALCSYALKHDNDDRDDCSGSHSRPRIRLRHVSLATTHACHYHVHPPLASYFVAHHHHHHHPLNHHHHHYHPHRHFLHHRRLFCSSTDKESQLQKDKDKDKDKSVSSSSSTWKWLKYVNPTLIVSKVATLFYNIIYVTLDSFIHPARGLQRLQSLWKRIKKEVKHLKEGSKLMWADIKTARKILAKFARGGELTFRERRQLRRATLDVLRFVPMIIIVLVPFLEAALPLLLWAFPNMLPSRFQSEHLKLERRKKLLSARIGLTKFFEDTLHEFVKETRRKEEYAKTERVESLENLLSKLKGNEEIHNDQILKIAALFDDEMALDNASHSVLSNLCRYMQLNTFGTTAMLRQRLYDKIRQIRKEDAGIRKHGLDDIPESLLKQLLRERGMRADFQEWVLRRNMKKWLVLSLDHDVPVTLLIMSRIFTLQHIPGQDTTEMLKDTISTIGEATTKEMLVEKGVVDDVAAEKEIIERQQRLIEEEAALLRETEQVKEAEKKEREKETEEMADVDRKRIRDLAESMEHITAESVFDAEKHEIEEIREKLQEIKEETEELLLELKAQQTHLDDETEEMRFGTADSPFVDIEQQRGDLREKIEQIEAAMKDMQQETTPQATEDEFESKEDEIEFQDEIDKREKTTDRISQRIERMIEKLSIAADERKFVNTLKRFADNVDDITEEELRNALKDTLDETTHFSDPEIDVFLKELDVRREKEPELPLHKIIQKLADDLDEEIDLRDIKSKDD
mmetsp:Transcript_34866/g.56889  ORF Transcript_34866/g.56889 Transcript_34866/m.56889 type:complete len:784 (+) Transcript_34866:34-2385(+)|eukprot:CAMPEP_0202714072 /NCGR_PEP_ID=MMETSP1385-20130828/62307_1 /ASSEMBLY_ACC=CAM_ASM_000861 /TAXON_ID=933848 /ORGANISM="Elphidium margaritaceum" /LENGTH=783 /DNA_ID=CAMNT_0049374639 /DNA_START=1 /DNA_END=2352 /DNA_ORIENTATION=+